MDVLVLNSWCFRVSPRHCCVLFFLHCGRFVDCTQKFAEFLCFCQFPIHFLWSVIFDQRAQVWLFFLRPLSLLESSPQFFCVHIPNAIKFTKCRTIPMKLWFLKIQNRFFKQIQTFFCQKWPKSTRGLKVTYENLTFSAFKCYNRVPGVSANPQNMKKDNPVTLFW